MSHQPKTILSIDDSLTIRKLIENALKPAGYEVLLAANGEEGLRLAREKTPDLILLDYVLPDVRGVELCQKLSAGETTRHIPVLLISGHGSAIQELYRDCANVVDYLTKPFAANVLQAVVANVLERSNRPATAATAATSPTSGLPASSAPAKPEASAVPGAKSSADDDNTAPVADAAVSAGTAGELRQRIFEKLIARLHGPLPSIPAWEAERGEQEPFSYYLSRLLPVDLLGELADDMITAGRRLLLPPNVGSAAHGSNPSTGPTPTLCGSTRFVSERHVLNHLLHEGVTGELRLTLPEETVSVFYDAGAIVAISSNHPRFYCAGSSFPFLQVPHAVVSAAMQAQREERVPFFVTAHAHGVQPPGMDLSELLRECGHRCLGRVYAVADVAFAFAPLAELPAFARAHRVDYSLPQLLLESYRCVSDWQSIQEEVPRLELFVGRTAASPAYLTTLSLNALECALLDAIDFRRTVAQLQELVAQPIFEVCRALYCLARLDLCYLSAMPLVEDETLLEAADLPETVSAESTLPVPGTSSAGEEDNPTQHEEEAAIAAAAA